MIGVVPKHSIYFSKQLNGTGWGGIIYLFTTIYTTYSPLIPHT
jgi:hypothetical protein